MDIDWHSGSEPVVELKHVDHWITYFHTTTMYNSVDRLLFQKENTGITLYLAYARYGEGIDS